LRSPDFFGYGEQKKSKDSGEKKKEEKLPRPSLLEVLENRELALSFRQFLHKWYSNEYDHSLPILLIVSVRWLFYSANKKTNII
jgi:hypothetical protein